MTLTLTSNRRSTASRATPQPHSNTSGARHSPWPAILEQLPEHEPDALLLALEFYREPILRRLVDDQGHVTLALVDVAEVARALSAAVSLASGILPGDETGPNTLFWARSTGATRLGYGLAPGSGGSACEASSRAARIDASDCPSLGCSSCADQMPRAPTSSPPPGARAHSMTCFTTAPHRMCSPAPRSAPATTPSRAIR